MAKRRDIIRHGVPSGAGHIFAPRAAAAMRFFRDGPRAHIGYETWAPPIGHPLAVAAANHRRTCSLVSLIPEQVPEDDGEDK